MLQLALNLNTYAYIYRYDFTRYQAVYTYLKLIKRGGQKVKSSIQCADSFFDRSSTRESYAARSIRAWAWEWLETGKLPVSLRGKHIKTPLLIADEESIWCTYAPRQDQSVESLSDTSRGGWRRSCCRCLLDPARRLLVCALYTTG